MEEIRRKVLAKYPYFGGVAAKTHFEESPDLRGMELQGSAILYDPIYIARLDMEEQIFSLARIYCHIALDHSKRGKGKDAQIWKTAAEAVVNQLLGSDGLAMARGSIDYPEAIGYDVEKYYEILLAEKLEIDLFDDPQKLLGSDGSEDEDEEEDQEDGAGEEEDDENEEDGEEAVIALKVSKAGNAESPDIRDLRDVGEAPASLDWRLLLRDSIRHGVDWSMQHAVIEDDGLVRPILEELPIPETEIVIDTSWSVDEELLKSFLRECKNILRLSKMRVGCFDTVFYGFEDIRTDEDIDALEFHGGGGTDLNAAVEAFTMRADNRIVLTDGEADEPLKAIDAIWVIYGDKELSPPGGRVIHIPL